MPRRFLLALILAAGALALPGCAVPTRPAVLAEATRLDERALIGLEASYAAARMTAEAAVDAGLVYPETAVPLRDINRRAYDLLIVARAAYDAANAPGLASALAEASPGAFAAS